MFGAVTRAASWVSSQKSCLNWVRLLKSEEFAIRIRWIWNRRRWSSRHSTEDAMGRVREHETSRSGRSGMLYISFFGVSMTNLFVLQHTLFLTSNGRVYSCGNNDSGQLAQDISRKRPRRFKFSMWPDSISCFPPKIRNPRKTTC